MGCERIPFIILVLLVVVLLITFSLFLVISAAVVLVVGITILKKLANYDPYMFQVYLRHIKYAKQYHGKPTPYRFMTKR